MIVIKDKNNNTKRGYISATDIQLLDEKDKFKHKNLEDAMQEIGSGTEQNMLRIEGKVDKLEDDKTNILNKFNDLAIERGFIGAKVTTGANLNDFVQSGVFVGEKLINAPGNTNTWWTIEVFNCSNNDYTIQRAMGFANAGTNTFERRKNLNSWTEWKQIATTESTELTLLNGWQNNIGDTKIYRNGNVVTLNLVLSGGATVIGSSIGKLPEGFRPSTDKFISFRSCSTDYNYNTNGHVIIYSSGDINLDSSVTYNTRLVLNASFGI